MRLDQFIIVGDNFIQMFPLLQDLMKLSFHFFFYSPVKETVVTNDRWGNNDILCKHGDFYTCDDKYNPGKLG